MGTPSWLYYLFGGLMFLVAAYCAILFLGSLSSRTTTGRDVDVAHILMGLAMAGMFVPAWSFGPSWLWVTVFAVLVVWFVARGVLALQHEGPHIPHTAIHALMSLAMMLMYWFPMSGESAGGSMMSGGMSATNSPAHLDPGLGYLLAALFLGSAVFTLASQHRGRSHHAVRVERAVEVMAVGLDGTPVGVVEATVVETDDEVGSLPWLEDVSHVVMCVAMAFMLVLMV